MEREKDTVADLKAKMSLDSENIKNKQQLWKLWDGENVWHLIANSEINVSQ